ncbi:MAG TPA: deoxyribodipyrimidine photolyase [Flavobacteriales bacterium]|nr:deoxyribodipyrimidine photolyase [Flavobacteriales bacterium]|tara:strand:- start:15845 stop:17137 length:1293 start_codon:yes stop_codon:yes gene_type:complete
MKISICWFRRDLRLKDNTALHMALANESAVLPLFIFDSDILKELPEDDARLSFIHAEISSMDAELTKKGSSFLTKHGSPLDIWSEILKEYDVEAVYINKDYEPYALKRDKEVAAFLAEKGVQFRPFKDQVIFEENDVLKNDGKPYTIYTPFKNKWLSQFDKNEHLPLKDSNFDNLHQTDIDLLSLKKLGFTKSSRIVKPFTLEEVDEYEIMRNFPAKDGTSYLSPHLRFGTVSARQIIQKLKSNDAVFLSELIWREFFMQILFHFPRVVSESFRPKYDAIKWRNNTQDFERWCEGETGYPMVDAGMRQLNQTGYMHNRVRMVVASFLCKHLLIDWRWGEAYFAKKLLDYDLSANNGNWQWAAGTGCDAAPYFRIFNPIEQLKKFDKDLIYTRKWVKNLSEFSYPQPMVDHKGARERALGAYKEGINSYTG